jgi:O-antigen/teichoic acid export membrane protein
MITTTEDHRKSVRDGLTRGVSADILARVGYLLTRFFIPPFVLARVSLEAYGLWATVFIVVAYVGVSTLGISNVYIKYVAEYSARREYGKANALLSTGLATTVPLCMAVYLGLWFLWPALAVRMHVPPSLGPDAREAVLMVVAIFLISNGMSPFHDVLVGVQRIATVQIIWAIAYLLETGLIVLLVGGGRGIRGLAEAFLARTIFETVAEVWVAFRCLPWMRLSPRLVSRDALRTLVSYGGLVQLSSLLAIALNSIERAIAVPLIGLDAAALLDIGKKLPSMAASIPSAFASALVPASSYLQGGLSGQKSEWEAQRKLYLKGARYMNLASGFVCGLLAVLAGPILLVWIGRQYPAAALLMAIFCVSTQVHLMTGPGTSLLKGIGRPKAEFHYCLPNLAILLLAVPVSRLIAGAWTPIGIGAAVAASTVLSAAWFIAYANRALAVSWRDYGLQVVVPGFLPYLLGAMFLWPAHYLVAGSSRWAGAIGLAAIGTVYSAALALTVYRLVLSEGERLWFRALIAIRLDRLFSPGRARAGAGIGVPTLAGMTEPDAQ